MAGRAAHNNNNIMSPDIRTSLTNVYKCIASAENTFVRFSKGFVYLCHPVERY
jgi:hypothetical protein